MPDTVTTFWERAARIMDEIQRQRAEDIALGNIEADWDYCEEHDDYFPEDHFEDCEQEHHDLIQWATIDYGDGRGDDMIGVCLYCGATV